MWNKIVLLFLFELSVAAVVTNKSENDTCVVDRSDVCIPREISWDSFMSEGSKTVNALVNYIHPSVIHVLTSGNISISCAKSLIIYIEAMKKWEPWALQMADANAKIPSGLLTGTKMNFGSFEECLKVRAKETFQGQFCMVRLHSVLSTKKLQDKDYGYTFKTISNFDFEREKLLNTAGIWLGTCVPSTCTEEDVHKIYTSASKPWTSEVSITDCQTDTPRKWTNSALISKYIFRIFLALCVLGTILDKNNTISDEKNIIKQLLTAFSLASNFKKLFEVKDADRTALNCLNGFRFFLSVFLILIQVINFTGIWSERKYISIYNLPEIFDWRLAHIENCFLFIENFFVISGLLLGLTLKKKLTAGKETISVTALFVQNYFRVMPVLLFKMLLLNFIPNENNGPIWNSTWKHEIEKCQQSWWLNLFFLQNFLPFDKVCLIQSWFLGSLMQTQIVGFILMLTLYRKPKIGIVVAFLLTALCISMDYKTALLYKYPMNVLGASKPFEMIVGYCTNIYTKPFNHLPSFLIGMALSAVLSLYKDKQFSEVFYKAGWISSILISQLLLFIIYMPISNAKIIALYLALRNTIWSLTFSWTIFACVTGNGGILNKIMSSDVFMPLSRISYCIFISHPFVLLYRNASLRERIFFGIPQLLLEFFSAFMATLVFSFFLHIAVELPFSNIYYTIFKRKNQISIEKLKNEIDDTNKSLKQADSETKLSEN